MHGMNAQTIRGMAMVLAAALLAVPGAVVPVRGASSADP
jgi:hypothetical protein